ncbi:MAG: ArnT family glycosyltransferase [Flavobacteriales bacterium]
MSIQSLQTKLSGLSSHWWFAFAMLLLMAAYSIPMILMEEPGSMHVWRQTDSLSFARHYYDNGLNPFDSQIFNYAFREHSSAKTMGEFPIIYYIVAVLWKIFGVHHFIYRLLTLLLFLWGLFSIFRLVHALTASEGWSVFVVALLFTSPALVYYAVNFLPDAHAISFAMVGCWCYYLWTQRRSLRQFYFAILCFTLAALLKPTAAIPFCVLCCLYGISFFRPFRQSLVLWFPQWKHVLCGAIIIGGLNAAYLMAVAYYNNNFGGWFTPNTIRPIWMFNHEEIEHYKHDFRYLLVNQAFSRSVLFLMLGLLVAVVFASWRDNKVLITTVVLSVLGCLGYALLFVGWDHHDYYLLELVWIPIAVFAAALLLVKNKIPQLLRSRSIAVAALALVIYNVWYCASNLQMRYRPKADSQYLHTASLPETEFFRYHNSQFEQDKAALRTIEPYLESIGVSDTSKVIAMPDPSGNVSLYLMHRRGYTLSEYDSMDEKIEYLQSRGARFLVVMSDYFVSDARFPAQYLRNKIGQFKNVSVYDLQLPVQTNSALQ